MRVTGFGFEGSGQSLTIYRSVQWLTPSIKIYLAW
jgi:hypothetical protein